MTDPDPRSIVDEILGLMVSFGGAERGGSGTGITFGGKVIKIPPRQDLQAMPTGDRDTLILQAVQVLTQDVADDRVKAALERATTEAEQLTAR